VKGHRAEVAQGGNGQTRRRLHAAAADNGRARGDDGESAVAAEGRRRHDARVKTEMGAQGHCRCSGEGIGAGTKFWHSSGPPSICRLTDECNATYIHRLNR
jgi:hypothetical protein